MQHQRSLARDSETTLRRRVTARLLVPATLMALSLLWLPVQAEAQSAYDFTIGVMGGIGGATDSEPDSGIDNVGLQLLVAVEKDNHTRFSIRLGTMDLNTEDFDDFFQVSTSDAGLTYLTLSGEYLFTEPTYESGIFIGLGLYQITDVPSFDGSSFLIDDEETFGITIGASGDFQISDHWSILGELSGHYADFDYGRFFVMGHVGLGFHF